MKELTYKDFEDYEQRLKEEAYYCMGDVISPKSMEGFESVVRCYMAMKDFEKALHIKQDFGGLKQWVLDILPTAKAGGFLHQPPLHSNRSCCVLHDVRQALLPVCPTVRYVLV